MPNETAMCFILILICYPTGNVCNLKHRDSFGKEKYKKLNLFYI